MNMASEQHLHEPEYLIQLLIYNNEFPMKIREALSSIKFLIL